MIGKPEWFARRKYTGWGLTPKTWQGWAYVVVGVLPAILILNIGKTGEIQIAIVIAWLLLVCADVTHIMVSMPKDERDRLHEAIAERNALWVIIAALIIGLAFEAAQSAALGQPKVDPVILSALILGVLTKLISNVYLDKKD